MKHRLLYILFLTAFAAKSQDKIFFLDGTTKTGKVTEIGPEQILVKINYENTSFARPVILLIEFSDGSTEIINTPTENVTSVADKKENFHYKQSKTGTYNYNQASINTLALCNADIAAFYERILPIKKIGLGVMGAYNFNLNATVINPYFSFLSDAKKKYDLGAFLNFYPLRFERRTHIYFGLMIKYTAFNYMHIKQDSVMVGNVTSVTSIFSAAKGSQLATLVTFGTQADISRNFFIKTIFGIGAFKLHGTYKDDYNYELNSRNNNRNNTGILHVNYLPKFYVGINIGFKL